ncbi:FMN-linked oxidoreductase [Russula brevipes]|nr:FMN-linked oxidoreductase [Russula brevipes]
MATSSIPKLFQPIRVGTTSLQHRVVLAPMTRNRADSQHVHTTLGLEYYKQRTSVPGTLAITEATFIAPQAGGYPNVPGIWNDEQVAGWKPIVDAVHKNGSFIYLQLWALGRTAQPDVLREEGGHPLVAPSPIPLPTKGKGKGDRPASEPVPRALTVEEIAEYVRCFASAAENAVLRAGFDGVEIHAANGYLPDQFLHTNANARTDAYGGSVQNRARFVLEIASAVVKAVGAERVGIRISPWSTFQGMRMPDPVPTFSEVVTRIRDDYPAFAYLHVLEPTTHHKAKANEGSGGAWNDEESNRFLRDIWGDRVYIANSDFGRDSAIEAVEKEGGLISFARHFISNPDLPRRLKDNLELAPSDFKTYYTNGSEGYIDYPFATEAGARGESGHRL